MMGRKTKSTNAGSSSDGHAAPGSAPAAGPPAADPSGAYEKPVLLRNDKYLARYPVPDDQRAWEVDLAGYAPIMFSALELYTVGRDSEQARAKLSERVRQDGGYEKRMAYYPPIWADPEFYGMSMEDREIFFKFNQRDMVPYHHFHGPEKSVELNRVSYLGQYQLHPLTGAPLNPNGRTGMIGRGLLGKYGPNHAADPVVTCFADADRMVLKIALICRQDTKQFALPGGMVDPGENELSSTAIREFCEEALEGNDPGAKITPEQQKERRMQMVQKFVQHKQINKPIISKVVDDPRNTDNAWMETQAFWFHFSSEKDLGRKLMAGDDAIGAQWVELNEGFDINTLYADHSQIVIALFALLTRDPEISKDFTGIVVPQSVQTSI